MNATDRTGLGSGPPPLPSSGSRPPKLPRPPRRINVEDDLIGTWFPRLGVVALVLGAAFGYKLAVDRGILDPLARVALGIAGGVALLIVGEATRRRRWERYAQAVTAGGIGLLTLVVWAAHNVYRLIDGPEAFLMLAAITATGAFLAVVNDSEALAVLATVVGFLGPIVTQNESMPSLAGYIFILDVGVLILSATRRWRSIPWVAASGSWVLFAVAVDHVSVASAIAYASEIFVLFALVPLVAGIARPARVADSDLALAGTTAFVYYTVVMGLLGRSYFDARAPFTAGLGILSGALALASHRARRTEAAFVEAGIALLLCTVAVPMGTTGVAVGFVWTIEAALLLLAGHVYRMQAFRLIGLGLLVTALADTLSFEFGFGVDYRPDRLLLSFESLTLVTQIAALYLAAVVTGKHVERDLRVVAWFAANVFNIVWLSWEAHAYLLPRLGTHGGRQLESLTYTGILGVYAGVVLAVGVIFRLRGARAFGLGVFGLTIAKMVTTDLWLLPTAYRTIGFIGIGIVLLACSLLYHRFREVLSVSRERTIEPETPTGAAV